MSVLKTQGFYASNNQRSRIRAVLWEPKGAPAVGVVQILPSFADHAGRYDEFARFLAKAGYAVGCADHIGTGLSVASDGERGALLPGEHMDMLRDADTLRRILQKKHPGAPYFLIGAGVGSFMARILLGAFSSSMAGAVLIGASQLPDWAVVFREPLERLGEALPESVSSAAAFNVLFGKLTRKLYKDDSELSWLSSSERALAEYIADPLLGFPQTREMTGEMLELLIKGSAAVPAEKIVPGFPLLFLSGGKDSVGLFGRGVVNASDLYMKCGAAPETVLYPAMRHEILHEDGRERVFADVLRFLNENTVAEEVQCL